VWLARNLLIIGWRYVYQKAIGRIGIKKMYIPEGEMEITQYRIENKDKIKLRIRARDRDLLARQDFVRADVVSRLGRDSNQNHFVGLYSAEELHEMLGYLALAASSTKDFRLERELETLYDHISRVLVSHDSHLS